MRVRRRSVRTTRRLCRRLRRSSMRSAVTGATAACFHTFTNRCTAVTAVRASVTHRMGMSSGSNSRPRHNAMMRSARSIRPPLASSPSDSALARM
ncbi:MAG TPA: hypothetical protein DCQ52_07875 [Acidimicrobiaceae bacterium]|nr:hypothetical protein [Acidimicrobiaceae bacterium]